MDVLPSNVNLNKITPREQEILELVLSGNTSKQIAKVLKISPRTVEIHRTNILRRWGVSSTPQIVNSILKSAKELEKKFIEYQNHYVESQEIAHLGSWIVHLDTSEVFWSDEMYRIFGYEVGSFTPTLESVFDHIVEEDRDTIKNIFNDAIINKNSYDADFRILSNNGDKKHIRTNAVIHINEIGDPVYISGISQDVTKYVREMNGQNY